MKRRLKLSNGFVFALFAAIVADAYATELLELPATIVKFEGLCKVVRADFVSEIVDGRERRYFLVDYYGNVGSNDETEYREIRKVFNGLKNLIAAVGVNEVRILKWGDGDRHPRCDFSLNEYGEKALQDCSFDDYPRDALVRSAHTVEECSTRAKRTNEDTPRKRDD